MARLPVILQTGYAECSLACLAMILTYHGKATPISELREKFPETALGASLEDIHKIAALYEMRMRALRVPIEKLNDVALPAILHWRGKHFVVLKRISSGRAELHDPAAGQVKIQLSKLKDFYSGIAVEFNPTPSFKRNSATFDNDYLGVLKATRPALPDRFVTQLLGLLSGTALLAAPLFVQSAIDGVVHRRDPNLLLFLIPSFIVLSSLGALASAIAIRHIATCEARLSVSAQTEVVERLLALRLTKLEQLSVASATGVRTAIKQICRVQCRDLPLALTGGIVALAGFVMLAAYSLVLAAIVAISNACVIMLTTRVVKSNADRIIQTGKVNFLIGQIVARAATIKSLGLERRFAMKLAPLIADGENIDANEAARHSSRDAAARLIRSLELSAVVTFGAIQALNHELSAGGLYTLILYRYLVETRVSDVAMRYSAIRDAKRLLHSSLDVLASSSQDAKSHIFSSISRSDAAIKFKKVSFAHPGGRAVLESASFEATGPGIYWIKGNSGSGKSTLLKLVAGLYAPDAGVIALNDKQANSDDGYLRSNTSIMLADCHLLSGTVADNISSFSERIDQVSIQEAAIFALIHEFISSLPLKYHSAVGDGEAMFSTGQRQRIALARAIALRRSILLLDEPTSHLDDEAERECLKRISSLKSLVFIASHSDAVGDYAKGTLELREGKIFLSPAAGKYANLG